MMTNLSADYSDLTTYPPIARAITGHLKYTIPPAVILTFAYKPFCTRLDVYKIVFLITIAIVATIPWDSYLIRRKIWTYPPSVIIGPTLFDIPAEEIFFFFIQTYNTSLLYLLLSKSTLKPCYLVGKKQGWNVSLFGIYVLGQVIIAGLIAYSAQMVYRGEEGTYMGLIGVWAGPFALLLRGLAYQLLSNLPWKDTWLPIVLPTLYLWVVDTFALQRGTWSIEAGTKLGIHVWPALEIEEAVFFLATNVLIVFGLVAFDNAMAILELFPKLFPEVPSIPSPALLIKALFVSVDSYDSERIDGISDAVQRLSRKSRSFYLASSIFEGRLRIDLILLVADDLVDNAKSDADARHWIDRLAEYLDLCYASRQSSGPVNDSIRSYIVSTFPSSAHSSLIHLPTGYISSQPLYDLLAGFKTDLEFSKPSSLNTSTTTASPISSEDDLSLYSSQVASTIASLCLELVFYHSPSRSHFTDTQRQWLISSGGKMGIALQYINIARDVSVDAKLNRVYLPTLWLKEQGLTYAEVIQNTSDEKVTKLRRRLLEKAFMIYEEAKKAMDGLPDEARAPMKVAVESYMEIGRCLRENGFGTGEGRATVPKWRRGWRAWRTLCEG